MIFAYDHGGCDARIMGDEMSSKQDIHEGEHVRKDVGGSLVQLQ